jgi:hypothetical protein
MPPNDSHALSFSHIFVFLEILLLVLFVSCGLEYLNLQCDKIVRESFQNDEHDVADYHFINVFIVFDPYVLKSNDVLPTPLNSIVLVSMQEL